MPTTQPAPTVDTTEAPKSPPASTAAPHRAPAENRRGTTARLAAIAFSPAMFALADQAFVSGTRFTMTLLVGRAAGPEELGVYTLAMTVVLLLACAQEALLAKPYMVYFGRFEGAERPGYAGSVVAHGIFGGVVASLVLFVLAHVVGPTASIRPDVLLALAAVVPCVMGWDLARRFAFAHLRIRTALAIDASVSTLQLTGLGLLWWHGRLTVEAAFATIGSACAFVVLVTLATRRFAFHVEAGRVLPDWLRNWRFGRWTFAAQISGLVHGSIVHWMLAVYSGTYETGLFAAAQSIVLLSNPILLGLGNLLIPSAARSLAEGGHRALQRFTNRAVCGLTLAMSALFGLLLFTANDLLVLLYGAQYNGHGPLVIVLAAAPIAWAVSSVVSSSLAAIDRPDIGSHATVGGLVCTVLCALVAIPAWGVLGGALSLALGSYVAAVFQIVVFRQLVSEPR